MSSCVIDTDVLVQLLRKDIKAISGIAAIPLSGRHTTVITCAELLYGAHNSNAIERNAQTTHDALKELIILPLTYECCEIYGQVKAWLRRRGITIGDRDLFIAAIALGFSLPIFTFNIRDFERIPDLKLYKLSGKIVH